MVAAPTPPERIRRFATKLYDPLRVVAQPVATFDASIGALCDDLTAAMVEARGVGMAAPQLGIPLAVAVFLDKATGKVREMVNPKILARVGPTIYPIEGCLSLIFLIIGILLLLYFNWPKK